MLLAIDTATKTMGIAVHDGSSVLAESTWTGTGYHTVELAPEIAMVLKRIGSSIEHVTAAAVASGPGSFTGLRIGMALAKGLALAHKLDLVGIPTHDILAKAQPALDEDMIAVIRAGRRRLSTVRYRWLESSWTAQEEPRNQTFEELLGSLETETVLCGEISSDERRALEEHALARPAAPALCVRRPAVLADLGWQKIHEKKPGHPANLIPVYTRSASGL